MGDPQILENQGEEVKTGGQGLEEGAWQRTHLASGAWGGGSAASDDSSGNTCKTASKHQECATLENQGHGANKGTNSTEATGSHPQLG